MSQSSSPQLLASGDANENVLHVADEKTRSASTSNSAKASRTPLPSLSTSVKVVLRIKKEEKKDLKDALIAEKRSDGKDHVIINRDTQHVFPFDKALNQDATQLDTYNAVIGNGIDLCLSGYHVSVFAYGQTGSGKTYGITGVENNPGILPLFGTNLFKKISSENLGSGVYVSLSFYEVYQEKVYDLLANNRKSLRVRGGTDDPYVENVIEIGVKDEVEMEHWRRTGLSRRATATTLMNDLSSRSHAIFCLKVQREYESTGQIVVSKCFFVDLAGSEKLPTSGGHRFNESTSINKSLLSLQRVVDARASNKRFVGYRDSMLTRLLKNCFDGNSVTTLLATVSPLECYATETLNTLRFASKAAQISQEPTVNEEVSGETIAYLREQNEFFMHKIAEMNTQIENLKQHCASIEKIQAPAILELYSDESLNQWTQLENGIKFSLLDDHLAKFLFQDNEWHISVLADGVYVNGVSLENQCSKVLKHGDVISYYERKFCAVYLDEKCDPQKFISYDRAKLEYVTNVFEKQKEEITEEIVAESQQNVKAVRETLESELEALRKELGCLREKLKDKSDEENVVVKKEVELVENMISDTEDVKKNLTDAVFKQTEIFKAKREETEEEKANHVMLKSKIEMMNMLLNRTGKSNIFDFRFHDLQTVKLFNKKNKVFVELDSDKFFEMYDHFGNIYQSNKTPDEILAEFNRFLYSSRYVWKPVRAGVGSSLVKTAVFNTLHETARKRRSTYAEVSNGFASRRSVIADIILKPGERPSFQPIDEIIRHLSLFALTGHPDSQEDLGNLSETSILINTCAAIRKNFNVFVTPENFMTATTLQKKATSIVGVYRSIGSLDALTSAAKLCYISPTLADIGLDYCPKEILDRVGCLRQLIESWINAVREDTLSKEHGQLIFAEIDSIINSVGHLAYFLGKRVEITDAEVEKEYMKGVMSAVHELTSDVPAILERCNGEKTTREKLKKLAATFVNEILKYAQEPFNEEIVFELCRRVIVINEQMTNITVDRAGKMIEKISEVIIKMEEFPDRIKPETLETFKDGLLMWKQLCKVSVKPRKARAVRS